MIRTNMHMLNKVAKTMQKLGNYGENNIFVSQYDGNEVDKATLIVFLTPTADKDDEYLKLRRMFKAMEYRFNHDLKNYELTVDIKRRAKG